MLLVTTGLLAFDIIVITLIKEAAGLRLPFCVSSLAVLDTAIIALSSKIIRSQNKK